MQALMHVLFLECRLHRLLHSGMQSTPPTMIKMCIDYIFVDAQRHLQWLKEMSKGVGLPAFDFTGGSGGAVGGLSGGRGAGGLTTGGTGGLTTGGTGGLAGGTGGVKTGGVGGLKTGGTGGLKAGGAGGRKTGGPGGLTVRGGGGGLTNGGTGGLTVTGGTGGLTVTGGAAGGLAGAGAGGFPYIICTMRIGKLGLIDNQKVFPLFFFFLLLGLSADVTCWCHITFHTLRSPSAAETYV